MTIAEAVDIDIAEVCRTGIPGYDPWATAPDGWWFDEDAALRKIAFVEECCTHVKGEFGGDPFLLGQWERAIFGNVFGWKRPDGTRRYRTIWLFVPRGNGKSPIAACFICIFLFDDDEPGAEIYGAAADRDQAGFVWEHAEGMVRQNAAMLSKVTIYTSTHRIVGNDHRAYYERISADAHTKHGMNIQFAVYDEVHCAKTPDLMDAITTAMRKRREPLLLLTTTSDYDRPSACNEKSDYAHKVRDGIVDDPSFLPCIWEATVEDDWLDEATWAKANPNLGVSVKLDALREAFNEAQETPRLENTVKRLHLNIRTEQAVRWLSMDAWDACGGPVDAEALKGHRCYAGLDLANTIDIASLELLFPDDGNKVLSFFWVPLDNAESREHRDGVPYATWIRQGFIEGTPGNAIDYASILACIVGLGGKYSIQDIAFDPWNATATAQQLADDHGFRMVDFRQGYMSMTAPTKELERMVVSGELQHGGNPVLRWMASNVSVMTDPAGNLKPAKDKSKEKIDGIVALIMATGRSMVGDTGDSVYEGRGLITI